MSRDEQAHDAAYGFVAVKTHALLTWDPRKNVRAPVHIELCGRLLVAGIGTEARTLPRPPPARAPARDRWAELHAVAFSPGRVLLSDFCTIFRIGLGDLKQASHRTSKRLRDEGFELGERRLPNVVGQPPKTAKISDLQQCYPKLC